MTTFGIDVSSYQTGLGLDLLPPQGYSFVMAKVTEGAHHVDAAYQTFLEDAQSLRIMFAAYHFLRSDSSADAQAENTAAHVQDESVPIMIDVEPSGSSQPDLDLAIAYTRACQQRGLRVTLLYYPKSWWSRSGSPPLPSSFGNIQADYGTNPSGYGSVIYPGDGSSRWDAYGGVTPDILQFGSNCTIDGYPQPVDADAFRGDATDLEKTGYFQSW